MIEIRKKSDDIAFGSLVYDQKERNLFIDKQQVILSSREGKVLMALMLAKGGVVPKHKLLNQVWGIDFDGDVNIVEVYIGYLRRKICVEENKKVIQTVRGIGYRLVGEAG